MHVQFGARLADAAVQVFNAGNVGDLRLDAPRVLLETIEIWPVELDLDRPRRAGQIIDDIRQNLHELDPQAWHCGLDFHPNVVDHVEDRARALTGRPEPRHNITSILFGREQPELGSSSARCPLDLRRFRQNSFHDVYFPIGFSERRPPGSEVIEYECTFVHLRQEPGSDESLGDDAGEDQNRSRDEHASPMVEDAL